MPRNAVAVGGTMLMGLAVWVGLSAIMRPCIFPLPDLQVTEDAEVVATSAQLREGIDLVVPNLGTEPITATLHALYPFTVTCVTQRNVFPGGAAVTRLSVRADAPLTPGEYNSTFALINEEARKLTIKVAHEPYLPVLVVLLGLAFSYIATRWWKQIRPGKTLERKALVLLTSILKHESEFSSDENNVEITGFTIIPGVRRSLGMDDGSVDRSLRDLITAGDIAEAKMKFESLQRFFDAYQAFLGQVRSLYRAYTVVRSEVLDSDRPKIESLAEAILSSTSIADHDHLTELSKRVEELCGLYAFLVRVYERYVLGLTILQELGRPSDWPEQDLASFRKAEVALLTAKEDLWKVDSGTDAQVWSIEERIETALMALRELWAMHAQVEPVEVKIAALRAVTPFSVWGVLVPSASVGSQTFNGVQFRVTDVHTITLVPDPGQHIPESLKRTALRLRNFIFATDALFMTVGWIVAAVTAMAFLYVGKPFGSWLDYLYAFLWGSGVDQALKGLSSVLGKLGAPISA